MYFFFFVANIPLIIVQEIQYSQKCHTVLICLASHVQLQVVKNQSLSVFSVNTGPLMSGSCQDFSVYWFSIFNDVLGVSSANNKLQQLVSSIFLFDFNLDLKKKKKQQKYNWHNQFINVVFSANCTIKKKGFTCHNKTKPLFVWGQCVHLRFM